jgi:hypothetical protein
MPLWSLYADRLELENDGQTISYRPTSDEIALIPIPGRRKAEVQSGVDRNEVRRALDGLCWHCCPSCGEYWK